MLYRYKLSFQAFSIAKVKEAFTAEVKMKETIMYRWLAIIFGLLSDLIMCLLIIFPAFVMLSYRRIGSKRLPIATRLLKLIGVFPVRDHYYEPLFNHKESQHPLGRERSLPGINFNLDQQLRFLEKLNLAEELRSLKWNQKSEKLASFSLGNGSFESGDAEMLYQVIRYLKPRKLVEVGCGNSTKIAHIALRRNEVDTGRECQHICIEPFEQPLLEKIGGVSVRRELLEQSSINWAAELEEGDILFIDSSHIIRPKGDVLKGFLEIIPSLKTGVYIHVHDIFTPRDYLAQWLVDDVRFWNEQYLLEALLTDSRKFEIVAAVNFLKHHHYDALRRVCPYLTSDREPGSFYFKIR